MKNRTEWMTVALAIVLVCGSTGTVLAAPQMVLTPGDHQVLRVQETHSNRHTAATALTWTLQGKGRPVTGVIPGTDDPAFDAYPTLFIDSDSGSPVLVWSRHNGVDYDLAMTRFDGRAWTAPVDLVSTERDEIQPSAYSTQYGTFHLVWKNPGSDGFRYGEFSVHNGVAQTTTVRLDIEVAPNGDLVVNPEGGTDDPGTGYNDEDDDCEKDEGRPIGCYCLGNGRCDTNGSRLEGASVCESFSVVVNSGKKACLLNKDADGWSVSTCQPFRGGAGAEELLLSLGRLQTVGCQP